MKIVTKILYGVLAFVALILLITLFLPKDYAMEREISINKPSQEVFDYLVLLKNQDEFSVWTLSDPNVKKSMSGKDGEVGAVSYWESELEDVGVGEQEIIKIVPGHRIDYELRFKEPFEATDHAFFNIESLSENETKVIWGFYGSFPYPSNLMLLFLDMEGELAPSLSKGLENLKANLED